MADAVTRSHLADGRVVGWYGEPGTVIDAEIRDAEPPRLARARFGADGLLGALDPRRVRRQARRRPDARVAGASTASTTPGAEVETHERRRAW